MSRLIQRKADTGSCFIDSIPDEILNEIFSIESIRLPFPQWGDMFHPALQVSKRWRRSALACHSLWTLIRFVGHELEQIRRRRAFHFCCKELEEWLKRSGNSPLDIRIENLPYIHSYSPTEQWDAILQPLLRAASRWRSCHLDAPLHPLTPIIVDLFRVHPTMDQFTSLYITGGDLGRDSAHDIVLLRLQKLTVAGDSSSHCLRLKCPSLESLTLEAAFLSCVRLQTLTEDMPKLHTLTLKHCIGPTAEQPGFTSIFPSLRRLNLELSSIQEFYGYYEAQKSLLNMLGFMQAIPCLVNLDCVLEDFHPSYVYYAVLGIVTPILQHLRLRITRSTTVQSQADLKYLSEETLSNRQFGSLLVNHLRRCTSLETLIIEGDRLIGPFSPPYPLHPVLDFFSSPQGVAACPKLAKIALSNVMVEDEVKRAFICKLMQHRKEDRGHSYAHPAVTFSVDHEEVKVTST